MLILCPDVELLSAGPAAGPVEVLPPTQGPGSLHHSVTLLPLHAHLQTQPLGAILQSHKTVQVGYVMVADDFTIHEFFIGRLYFFWCYLTMAQNGSGRKCYGC